MQIILVLTKRMSYNKKKRFFKTPTKGTHYANICNI